MIDATLARVIAPRPASAWVKLQGRPSHPPILAKNDLNLRVPPGALVTVGQDDRGVWRILGRER